MIQLLARNIPNPSAATIFPGDLVVCEHPWETGKLLVRRVRYVLQVGTTKKNSVVWVASETLHGGIDSRVFGPIPMSSILGRAIYYYNSASVMCTESSLFVESRTCPQQ